MVIDTKKENLCINQIVGKKVEYVTVEGDVIIPDIKCHKYKWNSMCV